MLKLLVLYAHLLATCLALGTIILTDVRILARMGGYKVVIAPPSSYKGRMISVALLVLLVTGVALIAMGDARTLHNPKLQGKLVLVALLCVNAVVLHKMVFPMLKHRMPLAIWRSNRRVALALVVGLSNSLWMYCAFLGIARPWNHTVSLGFVLGIAVVLWLTLASAVATLLVIGSRARPRKQPDMVDAIKRLLTTFTAPTAALSRDRDHRPKPAQGFEPTRIDRLSRAAQRVVG